jgi:hypothetical protein
MSGKTVRGDWKITEGETGAHEKTYQWSGELILRSKNHRREEKLDEMASPQ